MKKSRLYLLAILSGLLFALGWFPNGTFPFLFVAFVPLLILEDHFYNNEGTIKPKFLFLLAYLAFFIWNILVTWWVKNASIGGAVMAIFCNALLMCIPFMMFHRTKRRLGEKWAAVLFICFWLTFEFWHTNWQLAWPWLTIGNAFADAPSVIQWYEFTGVFGGSLWVLVANVLCFQLYKVFKEKAARIKHIIILSCVICVPIIVSVIIESAHMFNLSKGGMEVVVVQPNIDPYNEKFDAPFQEQLNKMLQLAEQKITDQTEYAIFPETALTEDIWEEELSRSGSVQLLNSFLKLYPRLKIVIGASTVKAYQPGEELSETSRKFMNADAYYDAYNTAMQLDHSGKIQLYHKSKLVPGVEMMPFPSVFKHIEDIAIDLGGTTGSLGMQKERTVFRSPDGESVVAPIVCYESVYSEYVSEYVKNGANFLAIITNDGWWGDTPGYRQHLKYGRLRAIETRRWIARSANTGVSCFINPAGEIQQATNYWEPAVISQKIQTNDTQTFYTKYGDYIARAALCISISLLIYSLFIRLRIAKK